MTRAICTSDISMSSSVPAIRQTYGNAGLAGAISRLALMFDVWIERQRLAALDERSLQDLGLSSADVERESTRSLFDLPSNRL